MEVWDREELYRDIWQQPMSKLAKRYGVSAVMIGKVCRKLSVPVPGRGYWARKESGQNVSIKPLPKVKNIPVIHRFKLPDPAPPELPAPEPTDPEYLRVLELESLSLSVDPDAPRHRLVAATAKAYRSKKTDDRGYRSTGAHDGALDLSVSNGTFERALLILNAVVGALEKEGFPVTVDREARGSSVDVFGQKIGFSLVEKYRQIRIEADGREPEWLYPKMRYEPNGILEFRVFHSSYRQSALRDRKKASLEQQISAILGALARAGRDAKIHAEEVRLQEIARRQRDIERQELAKQIQEEEQRLSNLDSWVTNWVRARQYREFIPALEQYWKSAGVDTSPESEKGKRLAWMNQQADRIDPLLDSPPSILDRKPELNRYWG